jgi:hypothetical protein
MTMNTKVREFSAAGPCITLGELIRITPRFFIYRDRDGKECRKGRDGHGLVHVEPCRSCRDHAETSYPHGYMN